MKSTCSKRLNDSLIWIASMDEYSVLKMDLRLIYITCEKVLETCFWLMNWTLHKTIKLMHCSHKVMEYNNNTLCFYNYKKIEFDLKTACPLPKQSLGPSISGLAEFFYAYKSLV